VWYRKLRSRRAGEVTLLIKKVGVFNPIHCLKLVDLNIIMKGKIEYINLISKIVILVVLANPLYAQTSHPIPANIPSADNVKYISQEASKDYLFEIDSRNITKIPTDESDVIIGKIEDVVINEGRLYILDQEFGQVKVFSLNGDYIYSFGRVGSGPGEFVRPEGLAVDTKGQIWVVDSDRSVSVFTRRNSEYKHTKTFSIRSTPQDVCAIKNRVYIYAPSTAGGDEGPVRVYNINGGKIGNIGSYYKSDHPLISDRLSEASSVACSERGIMAVQYRYLPAIYKIEVNNDNYSNLYYHKDYKTIEIRFDKSTGEVRYKKPAKNDMLGGNISFYNKDVTYNFTYARSGDGEGVTRKKIIRLNTDALSVETVDSDKELVFSKSGQYFYHPLETRIEVGVVK